MDGEFNNFIDPKAAQAVTRTVGATASLVKEAQKASGSIFENIGDLVNLAGKKATANPMTMTIVAALGSLYAGILSAKNLIHSAQVVSNPKVDQNVSWMAHALQGVLQGGLALGLAAPFLNMKSFFTQVVDGKAVVQTRMILGAVLAPILFGTGIKVAQNASVINKLPLGIGTAFTQIFGSVFGMVRDVTTSPELGQRLDQANPLGGAGIPAPTLAA